MMKFSCCAWAVALSLTLAPLAQAKQAGAVLPASVQAGPCVEGVCEYRLQNGLRVLLFADASKPTVTVNLVYGVGSLHENYGETGMAHLLEHLMFKGTPRHPDIPAEMQRRGISKNATTSLDRTNYFASFPANADTLDWVLGMEADRMLNAKVAKSDLDSEMTVVRNEMEAGDNSPAGVLMKRMRSVAYDWHNYANLPIGARSDVENVPIGNLQAFYRTWYQPDNALLIVAGRIDADTTLARVAAHFGPLKKPARVLPAFHTVEPTQDGEREVTVRRSGDLSLVATTYHVPALAQADSAALAVLGNVLGHTPSGRLHKALVETKLAAGAGAGSGSMRDPGLFNVIAVLPRDGDAAKAEAELLRQAEAIAARPVTGEEVEAAKQRIANAFELSFNNVNAVATSLSEYIASGDWRLWFVNRDAVAKVSAEDVNRVAAAYLLPSNRTLARFIPTTEPKRAEIPVAPSAASLVDGFTGREAVAAGEAFDPTPANIQARTDSFVLGDGLRVSLLPKKTRGEMVTATLVFRFGDEPTITGRTDAAGFAGSLLMRGSKDMSREQIDKRFDDLKATTGIGGSSQAAYITVTTKREHLPEALALAADVLRNPTFPDSEFEQLREQGITGMEASRREPSRYVSEAMNKRFNHWPAGHPLAFRTLDENLVATRAVKLEDVRAFHRDFYGTANGEVAVVGDFDPAQMKQQLQELFAGWTSTKPYVRIADGYRPVAAARESFETPDKANAVLVARSDFPLNSSDPDYPALAIANRIFGGGGMASRLGDRIRQKEGLSYGVGSQIGVPDQDDDATLLIQASAAPENMTRLEEVMHEELQRFVRDGITAAELADAKDGMLTSMANARANDGTVAAILRGNLYLDRTMQWTIDNEAAIRALTVEQVNAAIKQHIKPDTLSVFVAGDFAGAARKAGAAK